MLVYVHCNPITHFDAWGLEDQEDIDAMQAAHDEREKEFQEKYGNEDILGMNGFEYNIWEMERNDARRELDQSQKEIHDLQKELDNNRWGNTDIPNSGAGQPRGNKVVDGVPIVGHWADNTHDVLGGRVYTDEATPEEAQMYFKTDAQGNLVPKTHEDMVAGSMNALGDMGDQLAPVATACDVVAVGSGAVLAAPAVVSAAFTPAGSSLIVNGVKSAPVIAGVIQGAADPSPPTSGSETVGFLISKGYDYIKGVFDR